MTEETVMPEGTAVAEPADRVRTLVPAVLP